MSEPGTTPLNRPPALSIVLIALTAAIGFLLVGPLVGIVLAIPLVPSGADFVDALRQLSTGAPEAWMQGPVFLMQGTTTFLGLIVGPLLYWRVYEHQKPGDFVTKMPIKGGDLLLTAVAVVLFIIPGSLIENWNSHVVFPEVFKSFGDWARLKEDEAAGLTKFMVTFKSTGAFAAGFLVIGILPGLGEELVFRGMLQPKLQALTGNVHAAIWISAAIFSAIHIQFYGFVPRLFLGALFGYLYAWSGNLIVPIVAHCVNNCLTVTLYYFYQLGMFSDDPTEAEPAPLAVAIPAVFLLALVLVVLRKRFQKNRSLA